MNIKNWMALVMAIAFGLQTLPAAALSVSVSGDDGTQAALGAQSHVEDETEADIEDAQITPVRLDAAANENANAAAHASGDSAVANDTAAGGSAAANSAVVSVSHKEPGKLFGFISVMIDVTALADQTGNVTLTYPWYSMFVTIDKNLQTSLANDAHAVVHPGSSLDAQGTADLKAAISAALERFSGSAEASGAVNAQ